jgi:uncharacterized protein YraI
MPNDYAVRIQEVTMICRALTVPIAAPIAALASRFASTIAALLALAMPVAAQAQQAQTAKWVNLRAGPARDYPLVVSLPPSVPIAVQGCVDGYSWCDVVGPNGERGWIYAGNIVYPYQSGYVPIIQYGAVIGIPVVTFVIGSYWGNYYRHRPWYGNMNRWHNHPPPSWRPSPRPPGWRPPPPRPHPSQVLPPRPRPKIGGPRPPGERPGRPGGGRPGDDRSR